MIEASRIKTFLPDENGQCFIDVDKLCTKDYLIFVMASSMKLRKEMYDLNIPKYPVCMDIKLSNIGKTSFDVQTEGYVSDFPEPLFFIQAKTVFVCNETKKPKSPPDWWFEKFTKEVYQETVPMERFSMDGKDKNHSLESKVTVSTADVDSYLHSNWANYVRYSYNAYAESCISQGAADDSTRLFRQLSDLSILYKKETKVGDVLTTKVSPHMNDRDAFFITTLKDQDVACECRMKFHPL